MIIGFRLLWITKDCFGYLREAEKFFKERKKTWRILSVMPVCFVSLQIVLRYMLLGKFRPLLVDSIASFEEADFIGIP